jgi:hypothetical protein
VNSNAPKIFICFLPKFPETEGSDEIFDDVKPFILVAFPPLTLDHFLKTARKETNKHSSFIMKCDDRTFYKQCLPYRKKPCNINKAHSGYYPAKHQAFTST